MRNKVSVGKFSTILVALLLLVAGCSDGKPTRVPVSGTVLLDGKPLTMGSVQFVPAGARPSGGGINKEGRFVLSCYEQGDGAVVGPHRVRVTAAHNLSETSLRWDAPKMYSDIATSGLKVDVDGPTDSIVINLSWNGGKPFVERQ
jgi:hypothetical protein